MSVVYATDTERSGSGKADPAVLELARDAELLIYDAQYTDDEYNGIGVPARRGWGHSTVSEACGVASAAGARRLVLFHHDPEHDDQFVARMVRQARALFPDVVAAREGMTVDLVAADRRHADTADWAETSREEQTRAPYVSIGAV